MCSWSLITGKEIGQMLTLQSLRLGFWMIINKNLIKGQQADNKQFEFLPVRSKQCSNSKWSGPRISLNCTVYIKHFFYSTLNTINVQCSVQSVQCTNRFRLWTVSLFILNNDEFNPWFIFIICILKRIYDACWVYYVHCTVQCTVYCVLA